MKNLVTFPSGGVYEDSGEGGLYVMMVVPEPNGFRHNCHVDGIITVSEVDVEVTNSGLWRKYWDDASTSLLFAAHIGSTPESLWNADDGYFTANRDDLTEAGRALYESVKAAYGIDPVLVTCLDT